MNNFKLNIDTNNMTSVKNIIDLASISASTGSYESKLYDSVFGIDYTNKSTILPPPTDQAGPVFFCKPWCNLSYNNINKDRVLLSLTNGGADTLGAVIRAYLDPRTHSIQTALAGSNRLGDGVDDKDRLEYGEASPLVDPYSPFIPILSNTCTSLTGWPDLITDVYQGAPGVSRESIVFGDGIETMMENRTLTANFSNVRGGLVQLLFFYLQRYQNGIHTGKVYPWPDLAFTDCIDYPMRIFQLILDNTREYVTGIASAIVMVTSSNIGEYFNFNKDEVLKSGGRDVSIQFQTLYGVEYFDTILPFEFNHFVALYNHDMMLTDITDQSSPLVGVAKGDYFKVTKDLYSYANFRSYPYINMQTSKLEWYARYADLPPALQDGSF